MNLQSMHVGSITLRSTNLQPVKWLWISSLVMVVLLLGACTRERAEPEPTATLALPDTAVQSTTGGSDPGVTVQPPAADAQTDAATPTPGAADATPAENQPATASAAPATIDYRVQDGETISAIAAKFNIDVNTIRQLNYLTEDSIFAGQILRIPQTGDTTPDGIATPTPAPFRYTVQPGDTLGSIADRYGIKPVRIVEVNNLLNPDNLFVGTELIIPDYTPTAAEANAVGGDGTGTASETDPSNFVTHIVQPGQGLLEIAAQYGIDEGTLAAANGIANRNILRVGQQLIIPGVTRQDAAAARGEIHVVQSGESLASIAIAYGATVDEIVALNNLTNPDAIYVGQELIVPGQ